MKDVSQPSAASDWEWDAAQHRVGPFLLGGSIEGLAGLIERLERYPAEEWDTYLIRGTTGSKLFVEVDRIVSIQCGAHFHVEGVDVIGASIESALSHFKSPFAVDQQSPGYTFYVNEERSLKIIVDDKRDAVVWVIYAQRGWWSE